MSEKTLICKKCRFDTYVSLLKNGMHKRFTWEAAAHKYYELYHLAILRRRGSEYYRNRFGS